MITPDGRWKRPTEREKEDNRMAFVRDIAKNAKIDAYEEVLKWLPNNVKLSDLESDANVEGITFRLKKHLEQRIKELKEASE